MKLISFVALAFVALTGPMFAAENMSSIQGSPVFAAGLDLAQSYSCQPRKTCGRIGSCDEAMYYLRNCSWGGRLDGDSDGIPCESICR